MSAAVHQVAQQTQAIAPALNTPQILKTGLAGIWISTLLLMTAAIFGAQSHTRAMRVIGKDSAPASSTRPHIRAALADMDANAALESRQTFDTRRREAVTAIVACGEEHHLRGRT